jgi:hypothetical protein
MSRAGLYGSLSAAVAALLVVSCGGGGQHALVGTPKSPVTVDFTCDGGVINIGMTAGGTSGWLVETDQKKLRWNVPDNVTIDAISPKSGNLPVEPDGPGQGGTPGNSYRAKVKQGIGGSDTRYPYSIALTCQPSPPGSTPVKLIIDPEMIVR